MALQGSRPALRASRNGVEKNALTAAPTQTHLDQQISLICGEPVEVCRSRPAAQVNLGQQLFHHARADVAAAPDFFFVVSARLNISWTRARPIAAEICSKAANATS